ncbi:MAG: hypothetical protein IJV98_05790 [Clostridia bacterium]|nr:hypothetical protein [Clostridia bacterium]
MTHKLISKRCKKQRIAYLVVLFSFLLPIVFYIVEMCLGIFDSDRVLTLLQCVLGIIVLHVPDILSHKLRFEVPTFLYVFYLIFLYCAIFLGEFADIYNRVAYWDILLHCASSMASGLVGFLFISILNRSEHVVFRLSPKFVALFAFCFAVSVGALWEIYEFLVDHLMGLNMQKFILPDGTVLVGHAALIDTMEDIVIDILGALIAAVIGYVSILKNKDWLIPKLHASHPKHLPKKSYHLHEEDLPRIVPAHANDTSDQ